MHRKKRYLSDDISPLTSKIIGFNDCWNWAAAILAEKLENAANKRKGTEAIKQRQPQLIFRVAALFFPIIIDEVLIFHLITCFSEIERTMAL